MPREPGPVTPATLPHQLYALYTAERNLAFDLAGWFEQSTSIPLRLALADVRRDGQAQCLRLERLMQSLTGAVASRVAANMITTMQPPSDGLARHEAGGASTRFIITAALLAIRTTASAHRSAIASARAEGDVTTAALLEETLAEKREATAVLCDLRRGPDGGRAELPHSAVAPRQAGSPRRGRRGTMKPTLGFEARVVAGFPGDQSARGILECTIREQSLREADRRKDEFLAILAHELRNQLAPIANALEVLKRAPDRPAMIAQAHAMIDRQLRHVVRLVGDLLDVGRIARDRVDLQLRPVDLNIVIEEAAEACRSMVESAGHELVVQLAPDPLRLEADSLRLVQVVCNLLDNASKFTEPGGRVVVVVRREGDCAAIRVTDTGVGIGADMLPRVFDLFTQADRTVHRSRGGLGIGLALVKRLVELHGGTVAASSGGQDQGSTFTVRLPLAPAPSSPVVTRLTPTIAGRAAGRRILLVDDNRDGAERLATLLRTGGNDIDFAWDVEEAITKARASAPDLVLLDLGLQNSGSEACRAIRQSANGRRPTILAVAAQGQDRQRTTEAGFDGHLVKPVDPDALARLLSSLSGRVGQ